MCYTLKSVFFNTSKGLIEIPGGLDGHLLRCSPGSENYEHVNDPALLLTTECHTFILQKIAFGTLPIELQSVQQAAMSLVQQPWPFIQFLPNASYIFHPRWIEGETLCRRLDEGKEIVQRFDSVIQSHGPIYLDMDLLAKAKTDSSIAHEYVQVGESSDNNQIAEALSIDAEVEEYFAQNQGKRLLSPISLTQKICNARSELPQQTQPMEPEARVTRSKSAFQKSLSKEQSVFTGLGLYDKQGDGKLDKLSLRPARRSARQAGKGNRSYAEFGCDEEDDEEEVRREAGDEEYEE